MLLSLLRLVHILVTVNPAPEKSFLLLAEVAGIAKRGFTR